MKVNHTVWACLFVTGLSLTISCKKDEVSDHSIVYAFFDASSQSISTGDTVEFKDLSLGNPVSWKWTFEGGDPATSTEQNPTVVYNQKGNYKVSLEISNVTETSAKEIDSFVAVVQKDYLKAYLLAYYPFDGSADDVGPNKVPATLDGNMKFDADDRHGNANSAADFDGSSAVIIPDNDALNFGTKDFTVSCWLKTSQTSKMMVWQESGANGGGDHQTWLRVNDNSTNRVVRFDTEDNTGGSILNYGNGEGSGLGDNQWHQVVCVREGATARLYIDGEKKGELTKSTVKDVSSSQDFKIGTQEGPIGSYHTYFSGSLDDFKVFNKALTDQDIAYLYEEEK